jgi:hypothetical protein
MTPINMKQYFVEARRTRMKKYGIGLTAALILSAGSAFAGSPTGPATFQSLDKNHDGAVSKSEAKSDPTVAKNWKQIDINKDGRIDSAEFSAFEAHQPSTSQHMGESQPAPAGTAPGGMK